VLPEAVDLRNFYVSSDKNPAEWSISTNEDPVTFYSRSGIPFPKELLGYRQLAKPLDSRTQLLPISLRQSDLPSEYLDATAAHLCPVDFLTHTLLPAVLRQAGFTTVTLDPSSGYMNPIFWDDIPTLLTGLTAFLPSEGEARSLFHGRSTDLWEIAEGLASYGCEMIVIKRGLNGVLVYEAAGKKRWEIPAYPVKRLNPSGAGSAFCGGFLAGYCRTYDPLEAALYGSISASLTVEGNTPFYPIDVLPGLPEARLEALRQTTRKR
jgi:sugar/nucleoside kinase (ribokinase family)